VKLNIISWTRTKNEDTLKLFGIIPIYSKIRNNKFKADFQEDFEKYKSKVTVEDSSESSSFLLPGGVIIQGAIDSQNDILKLNMNLKISDDKKFFQLIQTVFGGQSSIDWIPIEYIDEYKHIPLLEANPDGSRYWQEKSTKILTISWANPDNLKQANGRALLSNLINIMENDYILVHSLDGSINTTVNGRDINTQMYLYEFMGRTCDFISDGYEFNVIGKNSSLLRIFLEGTRC